MLQLLSLAIRNLFRNTRRTALTVAAIAVGLAMMIATINLQHGSYRDITTNAISQLAGHVVVQNPKWQAERSSDYTVDHADQIAATLREIFPKGVVTQRMQLGGLLRSSTNSVGAGVAGFEPSQEAHITELDDKLTSGEWLADDDTRGVVIGDGMAKRLGVSIGDKVVFMTQPKGQEMQSRLFRVRGVFHSGSADMDGYLAVANILALREVVGGADIANQIAVHLPDPRTSTHDAELAAAAINRPDLFIAPWTKAIPEISALINVDRASSDVMMSVIGLIVALGVLNTVLMSVLERTREFGTMLAVGMNPRALAGLVLLEGACLGVLGAAVGLLLGLALSYPVVTTGLDYTQYMGETMVTGGVAVSAIIRGAWDPQRMGIYVCAAVDFTVLAAAIPAWRVSKMSPVEAMRHH